MSLRSDFYGKKRRTFFKAFKARRSDFGNSVACYHALRRPDNDFVFFTADLYPVLIILFVNVFFSIILTLFFADLIFSI